MATRAQQTTTARRRARLGRRYALAVAILLVVAYLPLHQGRMDSALARGVMDGHLQAAENALHWGANPNLRVRYHGIVGEPGTYWAAWARLLGLGKRKPKGGTPILALAGRLDRTEIASALVRCGADPNGAAPGGRTPLMYAARLGDAHLAEQLLAAGASVTARDSAGASVLHCAAFGGDPQTISRILPRIATVDGTDRAGWTPLMVAAEHRRDQAVDLLLSRGADPLAPGRAGMHPLVWAARIGSAALLARVHARLGAAEFRRAGPEALWQACQSGDPSSVAALLYWGVPPGARGTGGGPRSRLSGRAAAISGRPSEPVPLGPGVLPGPPGRRTDSGPAQNPTSGHLVPFAHKPGEPVLLAAARVGARRAARMLMADGADVNASAPDGETPLGAAVRSRQLDLVAALLRRGAKPNVVGPAGTPLGLACSEPDPGPAALLLQAHANPDGRDSAGDAALHRALPYPAVVALLLKWHARVDVRDARQRTPLMRCSNVETARMLLAGGADPNAVDAERRTPLIYAAGFWNAELARLLLQHGARVNAADAGGRTALSYAMGTPGPNLELADILRRAGARTDVPRASRLMPEGMGTAVAAGAPGGWYRPGAPGSAASGPPVIYPGGYPGPPPGMGPGARSAVYGAQGGGPAMRSPGAR